MHDAPTPAQLLAAVAEFLRDKALPELQGQTAFHARVAANVLDVVQRQWQLAPTEDAAERQRLRELLGADGELLELNRQLCARIANGDLDLYSPGLREHLWATTLAKLAVDQPGYAGQGHAATNDGPPGDEA
jgi:hypothetical protein